MVEQFFELLDYVEVPTFVLKIDPAGDPVYVAFNKSALDGSGFQISDVLGKTARDVYPGRLGMNTYERHLNTVKCGLSSTNEFTLPLSSGLRKIQTTLNPVKNAQGIVTHLVGTSLDITHQQVLRENQAESEAAANDIEDFVSMAAHDLRAPLLNIQALTAMLKEDFHDLGNGKLELVETLSSVATKTMDLISDVLSHSIATQSVEDYAEFDFHGMCLDILSVLDPQESCRAHISGDWVYSDRTAIQIALRNLFDNALKHVKSESPELWISVTANDSDTLKITVMDNGEGFEDPAILFLNGGRLRIKNGFGLLGVRRLIRTRRGTIEAKNNDNGSGAILTITLPGQTIKPQPPNIGHS